jgi:hypothetical protein
MLSLVVALPAVQWEKDVGVVYPQRDCPNLLALLNKVVGHCEVFQWWTRNKITFRKMEVDDITGKDVPVLLRLAEGGGYPVHHHYPQHRVVETPNNGYGVVILKGLVNNPTQHACNTCNTFARHNHVVVRYFNRDGDDLYEKISHEQKQMGQQVSFSRMGSAAGFYLPKDKGPTPKAMSKATINNRVCVAKPTKVSAGLPLYYSNKQGEMKCRYVYPDIYGRVLKDEGYTSNAKDNTYAELKRVGGSRRIALQNMKSRLDYFAILEHLVLSNRDEKTSLEYFVENFSWSGYTSCNEQFPDDITCPYDYFLLMYCGFLKTYINHQACTAHCDGDVRETMSLYSRQVGYSPGVATAPSNADGYLALLNHGVAIRMVANHSVIHASLSDTVHVADLSRNNHNYTEVTCENRRRHSNH